MSKARQGRFSNFLSYHNIPNIKKTSSRTPTPTHSPSFLSPNTTSKKPDLHARSVFVNLLPKMQNVHNKSVSVKIDKNKIEKISHTLQAASYYKQVKGGQ
jgi:hypothetical protein